MQTGENRRTRRTTLVLAAALGVAAVAFWAFSGRDAASRHPAASASPASPVVATATSSGVRPASDLTDRITDLKERLAAMDRDYREALRHYTEIRERVRVASDKDALAREVQAARSAVEDAIDHHPAIVALMADLQHQLDRDVEGSVKQAAVVTKLHAGIKQRDDALTKTNVDLAGLMAAERSTFGLGSGRKFSDLTTEEKNNLDAMQRKYTQRIHDIRKTYEDRKQTPDDAEKQLQAEYEALGAQRAAATDRYRKLYPTIPAERARVRAEDPAIAALDQILLAKVAQLNAATDANPELLACLQQVRKLAAQREQTRAGLAALHSQMEGISSQAPAPQAGTNG